MIFSRAIKTYDPADRAHCSIAAAIIGAGALGAGATAWGASKAADAQTSAAQQGIQFQQGMYENNKNMLSPFIDAGKGGIDQLKNWLDPTNQSNPLSQLLKLVMPGADMSATLEQTPGYMFAQKQGTRAALNALAARGLGGSPGAIAKGVGSFTSGLAANTWDSVVKNLLSTFMGGGGSMQNLVNSGVTAGSSLAGVGTNTANALSGLTVGAGNAQAAAANSIGGAVGGAGNSLTTAMLMQQMMGGGGGGSVYGSVPVGNYQMPTVGYNAYG